MDYIQELYKFLGNISIYCPKETSKKGDKVITFFSNDSEIFDIINQKFIVDKFQLVITRKGFEGLDKLHTAVFTRLSKVKEQEKEAKKEAKKESKKESKKETPKKETSKKTSKKESKKETPKKESKKEIKKETPKKTSKKETKKETKKHIKK